MSSTGHNAIMIVTARLPGGVAFGWHRHPVHQLAWAERGVLTVATSAGTWVLPPTRALVLPARRLPDRLDRADRDPGQRPARPADRAPGRRGPGRSGPAPGRGRRGRP